MKGLAFAMLFSKTFKKSVPLAVAVALLSTSAFSLTGCDLTQNHLKIDREKNMDRQDYRDALAPRDPNLEEFVEFDDSIPALQPYVEEVSMNARPIPLVSVSVNQTIPLRDVLFELADQAGYDLELDPRISGSIIFSARNKPFDVVIDRISDIAGLRYKFDDDSLRVELDTPYSKSYKIDYLTVIRTTASTMSNNISVVTGDGADTGSAFNITSNSEADFWGELETNMTQILESNASRGFLRTGSDPIIEVVESNAPGGPATVDIPVEQLTDAQVNDEPSVVEEGTEPQLDENGVPLPTPGQDTSTPPVVQPRNTILQVTSSPAATPTGADGEANEVNFTPSFSINRQAGLVSVYANERIHKEVADYLGELKKSLTSQVLIEAKVLEVSLSDEFSTGIDWAKLGDFISPELSLAFGTTGAGTRPALTPVAGSDFVAGYVGSDLGAVVQAISRFGTVSALASPRMTVLNNQAAALNVAQNSVYFEIEIDVTTEEGVTQTDIDSDIRNVPEGVLINVLPTINPDTGSITMQVRPTVTRIVNRVEDPAVAFVAAQANITGISSQVPELNVQEIDSILSMQSGEVAVLGGLIQDRVESQQESVPVLGEVPVIGAAFRNQGDSIQKTELVIFLKATIVDAPSSVSQTDKELYRTFSQDRRPLKF